MKSVLITGSEGFVGTNLREFLRTHHPDVEVHTCDLADPLAPGDVCDVRLCETMCRVEEVDAIVHLAGIAEVGQSVKRPRETMWVNANGTLNVLEAARSCLPRSPRVILASSSTVTDGRSPYAASKAAAEALLRAYCCSYGVPTLTLRFDLIYGPHSLHKETFVHVLLRRLQAGQRIEVFGDGSQLRDFVHVEDVCRAIVLAAQADECSLDGERVYVGTGKLCSVSELVSCASVVHRDMGHATAKEPCVFYSPERTGEMHTFDPDLSRACAALGYHPTIYLDEGLRRTYAWHAAHSGVRHFVI